MRKSGMVLSSGLELGVGDRNRRLRMGHVEQPLCRALNCRQQVEDAESDWL